MNLRSRLIKLGHTNPEIRPQLRAILDSMTKRPVLARLKTARKVEKTLSGPSILGPKPLVAEEINAFFYENKLNPYMTTTQIEGSTTKLSIAADMKQGRSLSSEQIQEIAQSLAKRLRGLAYRNVKGRGFYSDVSESVHIVLTQRV